MHKGTIPPDVFEKNGAHEKMRFWVLDGDSHVFLNIGMFEPEDEAELWGSTMADIAMQATRGMTKHRPEIGDEASVLAQIDLGYRRRLDDYPTEVSGQVRGDVH